MRSVVIAVAITGSVPRKRDNPAVPVTVTEQIEVDARGFRGRCLAGAHSRAQRR